MRIEQLKPGMKIIVKKQNKMIWGLRQGQIYTVEKDLSKTVETPQWNLTLDYVVECFEPLLVNRKSHLPKWW